MSATTRPVKGTDWLTPRLPLEDAAALAGVPDEFQRLWTPHRMAYIQAGAAAAARRVPVLRGARDVATRTASSSPAGGTAYVLLNLFPYNSGHLLVCPYRHIATYDEATDEEVAEMRGSRRPGCGCSAASRAATGSTSA